MSDFERDQRFYDLRDAMFGDREVAAALLTADPTAIEARSGTGETALYYLAIENELEGVKWLLERGANINTRDNFQSTPLIGAAQLGYLEMCRFLLEKGADIFAMDHIGKTAISATCDLKANKKALLEILLIHKGDADINLFFDDSDAEYLLTGKGAGISEYWSNLGLVSRYNYPPKDEEI